MAAVASISSGCKEYHHGDVKEGASLGRLVSDQEGLDQGFRR